MSSGESSCLAPPSRYERTLHNVSNHTNNRRQNDLSEYFSLLNFANPNFLGSKNDFRKNFENAIIRGRDADATDAAKGECEKKLKELGALVAKFIIRRTNDLLSKYRMYLLRGAPIGFIMLIDSLTQCPSNTSRSFSASFRTSSCRSTGSSYLRLRFKHCSVERNRSRSRRSTFSRSFATTQNYLTCLVTFEVPRSYSLKGTPAPAPQDETRAGTRV